MRVSELAGIDNESIRFSSETVSFSLLKPRKAQHGGAPQSFSLKVLPEGQLDPAAYLQSTASLRNDENKMYLLIGSVRPHNPVVSSTLSGWVKRQIGEAGIDLTKFFAHSTRGAAASKAAAAGVPVQSILDMAHWASESTFSRFYRREVEQNTSVAESILSVNGGK